jgi:hypothetical protein
MGRSVDCRAGPRGSKELFSNPVSAQNAVEATSAPAQCSRQNRYFTRRRRRKWLDFGQLGPSPAKPQRSQSRGPRGRRFRVSRRLDSLGKPARLAPNRGRRPSRPALRGGGVWSRDAEARPLHASAAIAAPWRGSRKIFPVVRTFPKEQSLPWPITLYVLFPGGANETLAPRSGGRSSLQTTPDRRGKRRVSCQAGGRTSAVPAGLDDHEIRPLD